MGRLPVLNSHQPPAAPTTRSSAAASSSGAFTASLADDPSKKIRKPYTITKSREIWTEQEHDKFLEALQLFDRDWKKIEAFVGSKTVIQIRSHAQKYFLKVQKSGTSEHLPPPRPKRKAAHPYPHKAPKNAASHPVRLYQCSTAPLESGYTHAPEFSYRLGNPSSNASLSSWSCNSLHSANASQVAKDDVKPTGPVLACNPCYSGNNESSTRTSLSGIATDRRDRRKPIRAVPDFDQVYSFIGSVFDPNATGHLQRLKQMDPINLETALLLMKNLTANLSSPDFEEHRRLLTSYNVDFNNNKSGSLSNNPCAIRSESVILSV